jgi:hypothetical protein
MWFKQTPEKLLSQPDVKRVVNDLVARIKPDSVFEKLSRPEQVLLLVYRLRAETLNGTLEQYLANSSGDMFSDALNALGEIGATKTQTILAEVGRWFPEGQPSPSRAERSDQIDNLRAAHGDQTFELKVRQSTDALAATFSEMLDCLVKYLRLRVAEIS